MKLKVGDNVKVIAGRDKGKTGKITQVFNALERVVVDGVNKRTRHLRPQKRGEKGERIEFFAPFAISNIMLICPKCGKHGRVGKKMVESPSGKAKKLRVCKKCNETIE